MNSDEIDELIERLEEDEQGLPSLEAVEALRQLQAERQQLLDDHQRLLAENESLRKGLGAVADLINESEGVAGLHLNGDIAPWDELREGGRFEDWLVDFDAALERQKEAKEGTSAQLQQEQERKDE